jgi:hypothetical protein
MCSPDRPEIGMIAWRDLTVKDAGTVRDFYRDVVGWRPEPVDMGGYSDFNMVAPATGATAAGICHARGGNADLPPQWLMYIVVEDVERAARTCRERGGEVVIPPRPLGDGMFCVIRDPAGAVCALYRPHAAGSHAHDHDDGPGHGRPAHRDHGKR